MTNRSVLLAYGEKEFTKKLKAALERRGYTAAALWEGDPPRAQYDFIVQLARDPADLAEGTGKPNQEAAVALKRCASTVGSARTAAAQFPAPCAVR